MATQQDKQKAIDSLQEQLNAIANLPTSDNSTTLKDALQNKLDTLLNTTRTFSDTEIADAYELSRKAKEQSLALKVTDLEPNETRAIFKNVSVDLRMYKQLKMFVHTEGVQTKPQVQDEDLQAIVRLGSDLTDNFYQLEKILYVL